MNNSVQTPEQQPALSELSSMNNKSKALINKVQKSVKKQKKIKKEWEPEEVPENNRRQSQLQESIKKQKLQEPSELIDCEQEGSSDKSKSMQYYKKQRKTRTLITKEKLMEMNKIFQQFLDQKKLKPDLGINLKNIAHYLQLGYSTILHKYREFRAHNRVKAGALITSMQKKRKYKKSVMVQNLILKVMKEKEFYTASEMTKYIEDNYHQKFSRSIISRHLGQMGYSYKNLHYSNTASTVKYQKIRNLYTEAMRPLIQTSQTLIFIDQMSCCLQQSDQSVGNTVSILMACTIYGILYFHLQEGFVTRSSFLSIVREFLSNLRQSPLCKNIQGEKEELYLVVDMNYIHRDNSKNQPGIANMLIEQNAEIFYIPPCTPEFNPIEPIFNKIRARLSNKILFSQITNHREMWQQLESILQEVKQESTEQYFMQVYQEMGKYLENAAAE